MKKTLTIIAVALLFTATSCGSSWSCKKRYCDNTDKNKTQVTVIATNDNA